MKLSIIILNYNTKDLTSKCISSIKEQYSTELENKIFEIIVVDNASSDDSVRFLEKVKEITLIKNKENFGFSKGCNIGAGKATGKYFLFLNSDTQVKDKGLSEMIDFLEKNPKIGILGGKLLNSDGSQQASCGNFYNLFNVTIALLAGERIGLVRKNPKDIQEVDWVSGAAMMIRRDLFGKLKGFDEKLFMYMEDMELCFRTKKKDLKIYFFSDVKIVHQGEGSSNRSFAVTNIYRGITYFYKKHANSEYPLVWFLLLTKAIFAILVGVLINNNYLKKTYSSALKIAI